MRANNKDVLVHVVGIGGIGMSAIAEVLIRLGFKVQGSDISDSANVIKLRSLGATVHIGHREENLGEATVLVHSSAVTHENPEYKQALENGIPIMRRAEMLADIMNLKKGIAIAGTHGKTTTTSIFTTLMKEAGYDPTYIIGGIVHNLGGHAHVGKGEYIVAEADESDGSFLMLNPVASVITNIDDDHIDHYGSREGLVTAFTQFANNIPFFGVCALNIHDEKLRKLRDEMKRPYVTFGIGETPEEVDYHAINVEHHDQGVDFDFVANGENKGRFKLSVPGRHNVLNTLGALSIAVELGLDIEALRVGLSKYEGVGRRFQKVFSKDNFEVIDDYAHHPTEIFETIKTAKDSRKGKEVLVIFEPHRFTRTKTCWQDFLHCFNLADRVLIAPIYPASEKPIPGINSESLSNDINKLHPDLTETFSDWVEVEKFVKEKKDSNAILLALGAGSVGRKVKEIVGNS